MKPARLLVLLALVAVAFLPAMSFAQAKFMKVALPSKEALDILPVHAGRHMGFFARLQAIPPSFGIEISLHLPLNSIT